MCCATMHIWIKNFSTIAQPLVYLTHKDTDFIWTTDHNKAMDNLKTEITNSSAFIPINYTTTRPVYLAVDSSWRAVGWILSQQCEDGQQRPSHFGSIAWNECKAQYSQPKIELYGLFRALCALQIHIVSITNLVIEIDVQFICGMINNPDVQPNAAMNCWIAVIRLFSFKLAHVPAQKHLGADGLSQHEPIPGKDNKDEDPEDWINNILSLGIWVDSHKHPQNTKTETFEVLVEEPSSLGPNPNLDKTTHKSEMEQICEYLINPIQGNLTTDEHN
jgi:hypothetical protein